MRPGSVFLLPDRNHHKNFKTKSQRLPVPVRSYCKLPRLEHSQPSGQVYIITSKEEKSGPKKGTVVNKKLKKSD